MTNALSARRPAGPSRSAGSDRPRELDSSWSSRGTSCGCPASERSPPRYRWTSTTRGESGGFSSALAHADGSMRSAARPRARESGNQRRDRACKQSALANPRAARGVVEPPGATGPTGDWEKVYATSDVATLPWYSPALDADIERALKAHRLRGVRILDLGTGPATQAMNLAKRGFEVVATDISASAIKKAKASAKEAGLSITFLVDNVLKSRLSPNLVDVIVDRGVFHVMPKDKRPVYVETVHRVLRPKGWLFLKCFSDKEPGTWGPFRIAEPELIGSFPGPFEIRSVVETVFQGNVKPPPKALFASFRRS